MSMEATAPPLLAPLALTAGLTTPRGTDYYLLSELLTDEQREIRCLVENSVDTEVVPSINDYWERAQ